MDGQGVFGGGGDGTERDPMWMKLLIVSIAEACSPETKTILLKSLSEESDLSEGDWLVREAE